MRVRNAGAIGGLALVMLAGGLTAASRRIIPDDLPDARLALGFAVVSLLGLAIGFGWERDGSPMLRRALMWLTGATALLIALSFHTDARHALVRVLSQYQMVEPAFAAVPQQERLPVELDPSVLDAKTVTLKATANGHFFANALVNGKPVTFLVDTGSTDVALSPSDARDLGIDVGRLNYEQSVFTANGPIRVAVVQLKTIALGPLHVENVTASIPQVELRHSLLGMSFLKRLTKFSMDTDRLVLKQ